MVRTLDDGHFSPLDLEALEGNLNDQVADIKRSMTAVRRNQDTTIPDNAVEFADIRASNLYDGSRGQFVTMAGIDAVQLVSGNEETVVAGMQCVQGPGTAYFEVSAPDDGDYSGGTAYGWRSGYAQNVDMLLRYYGAGTVTVSRMGGETETELISSAAVDNWDTVYQALSISDTIGCYFTATKTGSLPAVKLYLKRSAAEAGGTVTLALYNVDASHLPTDLIDQVTMDGSAISTTGEWVEFRFSPAQTIANLTEYALVPTCGVWLGGVLLWGRDGSSPAYANGAKLIYSSGSWSVDATSDMAVTIVESESGDVTVAASSATYRGWTEAAVNTDLLCSHEFYSGDNAADFYVTIPDGGALNALCLRDTTTGGEVHWRAGHVRTRHIAPAGAPTWLDAALTNASWNNDSKGTVDNGTLDLSALFAVPAGVRSVYAELAVTDTTAVISLGPDASNPWLRVTGWGAGNYNYNAGWVKCDANGDVYFTASDTATAVSIRILAYWP